MDGSKSLKLVDEMAERLVESHILPDISFATGSSVLHPRQAAGLSSLCAAIKNWLRKYPDGKLAVFGHADAIGKESDNKRLSERRAQSVYAFLVKDAGAWDSLATQEKWGLKVPQEYLTHFEYYSGTVDGQDGPKTQVAAKTFQGKHGLPETGEIDSTTRKAIFKAYIDKYNGLQLKPKDFDDINGNPYMGCSESNLADKTQGASATNRRVGIFLLKSNKNFPIQYPCAKGDTGPCGKQAARKGDRRTTGFACVFYDKLIVERPNKGGGAPKSGKVKWVGITAADIKQYVNLDPDPQMPAQGMERVLEVEVEGLSDGGEIHWLVTAGKNNSKRTDPKTGPVLKAGDKPQGFKDAKAELATKVASGKSSLILACGVGGGDEFTVEVGTVQGTWETKVKIVTWRKLVYETIQPSASGPDRLTDYTVFTPDKKPGLPAKSKSYLDKVLGQGFVEFEEIGKDEFSYSDLPDKGSYNVMDASLLGKPKGMRFMVATGNQLKDILDVKAKQRGNKRAVSMIWTDYLASATPWKESFLHIFKPGLVTSKFSVFENTIETSRSAMIGTFAIQSLSWSATHWLDSAASKKGEWKPIVSKTDPGGAYISGGTLTSEEDIRAHVSFESISTLRFNFPDTKPNYPGKIVSRSPDGVFSDQGILLGITISIEGFAYTTNCNGMAINGIIWMNSFAGQVNDVGMAGVIAHELGHNMGQAYGDKSADAEFGRPSSKPIPGIPFPKPVPEGDVYGGHGHKGLHCAKGVFKKSEKQFDAEGSTAFK